MDCASHDCARAAFLPVGQWPVARVQLAGEPASAYLSCINTEIIGIVLKTNRDDSTLLAEGVGDCEPPAVGRTALARHQDRAFPGPQMQGTWGTRLRTNHLLWGRRRATRFVASHPFAMRLRMDGAPSLWCASIAPGDVRRWRGCAVPAQPAAWLAGLRV
jgi:hypothetical protein